MKIKNLSHTKPNASIVSIVQRVIDILSIFTGLFIAITFLQDLVYTNYFIYCLLTLATYQLIGGITDFYRSWRGVSIFIELSSVFKNWAISFVFSIFILNLIFSFKYDENVYLIWFVSTSCLIFLLRSVLRFSMKKLREKGFNIRRVAFVGSNHNGKQLMRLFNEHAWLGFKVVGKYGIHITDTDTDTGTDTDIPYNGDISKLILDAKNGTLDKIYLSFEQKDSFILTNLINDLTDSTCSVVLIPDNFTSMLLYTRTEEIHGVSLVPIFDTPLNGLNSILKRLEDIILSSIIICFISPLLFIISIIILCTSRGPIFFKQSRYGIDGKEIKVFKFRSMQVMENGNDVKQVTKNDHRVTKFGAFLRKTSLDELPQFFNVLFGSMSIVGPRPHAVYHNEYYRKKISGYMLRHKVKPGITGWAQINGWRGETDTLDKMQGRIDYDLYYIKNWSILFDLKIIFLTIFKGFINKSAY